MYAILLYVTNVFDLQYACVISASDDRYQDHCDEVGLSIVRLPQMPKLKTAKGSMCTKTNNKKTRINSYLKSVSGLQNINIY